MLDENYHLNRVKIISWTILYIECHRCINIPCITQLSVSNAICDEESACPFCNISSDQRTVKKHSQSWANNWQRVKELRYSNKNMLLVSVKDSSSFTYSHTGAGLRDEHNRWIKLLFLNVSIWYNSCRQYKASDS